MVLYYIFDLLIFVFIYNRTIFLFLFISGKRSKQSRFSENGEVANGEWMILINKFARK